MDNDRDLAEVAPGLDQHAPGRSSILEQHRLAIEAKQDGYIDPVNGLFVMTAAYHVKRGTCCDSSCRHCPY